MDPIPVARPSLAHPRPEVPVIRSTTCSAALLLVGRASRRLQRGVHRDPVDDRVGAPLGGRLGGASPSPAPVKLVVGLGYIPSVQFAQFYLADQRGYYRDAGLEIEFQNKIDPDLIRLVGQGAVDVAVADGTSRHPRREPGDPGPLHRHDLRQVPEHRVRQGELGDPHRGGSRRPQARHAGTLRLGLDHAPGAAPVGRPDDRRPDRGRVPRLRSAGRGGAGCRGRRDRVRQQRARAARPRRAARLSCFGSTTSCRCRATV